MRTSCVPILAQIHYVNFTPRNQLTLIAGASCRFQNGGGGGEKKTGIDSAARRERLAKNNSIVRYSLPYL